MFTCIPCLKTKGVVEEITTHMKDLSLGLQKRTQCPDLTKTVASTNKQNNKKKKTGRRSGGGGGGGGDDYHHHPGAGSKGEEEKGHHHNCHHTTEWVAEADGGVLITFVSLPHGGNRIRKIRFSEDVFDVWEAQKWWSTNYEKITELYNVRRIPQSPSLQSDDDDGNDDNDIDDDGEEENPINISHETHADTSRNSDNSGGTSSGPGHSSHTSTAEEVEEGFERRVVVLGNVVEWVVEDEPGVFVTIRSLPNGAKEIRRVELSREKFSEVKARVWWEENKARLNQKYT